MPTLAQAQSYNTRSSLDLGWRVRQGGAFTGPGDAALVASVREYQTALHAADGLSIDGELGPMTGRSMIGQINARTPLGLAWFQNIDFTAFNGGAQVRPPGGAVPPAPPPAPPAPPSPPAPTPTAGESPWPGRLKKAGAVAAVVAVGYTAWKLL